MKNISISYNCDRCKCEVKNPHVFKIEIDKVMDPSGNGYNSHTEEIHICDKCLGKIMQYIYDNGHFEFHGLPKNAMV